MGIFSRFHPSVIFTFYLAVIIISIVYINPVYLIISFAGATVYYIMLKGKKGWALIYKCALPIIVIAALFNMIFTRYGSTILFRIGSVNFTFETFIYGLCCGMMMAEVIIWFACYNYVFTSDKLEALFGRIFPNLTLLFSMTLRFIPLMQKYSNEIKEAQIGAGNEIKGTKNTIKRFSALISVGLEKSIETADSMKQRGYENKNKKYFSRYPFRFSDALLLAVIVMLFIVLAIMKGMGFSNMEYTTNIMLINENHIQELVFLILIFMSIFIDAGWEVAMWHKLKSTI